MWGILCGCAGQGEALPIRPVAAGWREARVLFCGSEHGASVEEAGPGGRRAVLVSNTEVMCRYRHLFTDISVTRRWVALLSVPESPSPGYYGTVVLSRDNGFTPVLKSYVTSGIFSDSALTRVDRGADHDAP